MVLDLSEFNNRWLAVQVHSGREFMCAACLKDRGYEEFVPQYQEKRKWSDRVKVVLAPLFAGYVFVRFKADNPHPVVSSPGVLRLVGMKNRPIPIEGSEIQSLRIATTSGAHCEPCGLLKVGEEVEINWGPLSGVRGRIVRIKNRNHLIISVNLLMRSVSVELDSFKCVSRIAPNPSIGRLQNT